MRRLRDKTGRVRRGRAREEGGRGDGEGERKGLGKREVGIGRDSNLAFYAQLTYTVISGWKGERGRKREGREVGRERR